MTRIVLPLVGGAMGALCSFLLGELVLAFWFCLAGSYCSLIHDDTYLHTEGGGVTSQRRMRGGDVDEEATREDRRGNRGDRNRRGAVPDRAVHCDVPAPKQPVSGGAVLGGLSTALCRRCGARRAGNRGLCLMCTWDEGER